FTLLTPGLSVTSPSAGTTVFTGTPLAINWATNLPAASLVSIDLTRDGGATYQNLTTGAPNTGTFAWTVAGPDTAAARVRVTLTGPGTTVATSDAFGIATPSLTAAGPTGTVYVGTTATATWTTNLPAATVLVELSRDGGASF